MLRIAIDLTPVLPGSVNGGAKIMTLQLVRHLADLAKDTRFILLSSKINHDEISTIKAPNIETICVKNNLFGRLRLGGTLLLLASILLLPVRIVWKLTKNFLPMNLKLNFSRFKSEMELWARSIIRPQSVASKVDLLFCPFTIPNFRHQDTPIISVIYDLQCYYHPEFFTSDEICARKNNFDLACHWATKLICISDFARKTVLENSHVSPQDTTTIHIRLANRLPEVLPDQVRQTLDGAGLTEQNYLLFPANFWAHKNHETLFKAFSLYRSSHPDSALKLVCTGTPNDRKQELQNMIKTNGWDEFIIMPGYLSDDIFAQFLKGSRAIIFPSLYEGFGMPVLEAMAASKPVLCSNTTSLPEVAGTAALLFDPKNPEEIAQAIHRLEHEPELANQLIERGHARVAEFGSEKDMAKEYLAVFREVITHHPKH